MTTIEAVFSVIDAQASTSRQVADALGATLGDVEILLAELCVLRRALWMNGCYMSRACAMREMAKG